jgi:cold shock CspA family protein
MFYGFVRLGIPDDNVGVDVFAHDNDLADDYEPRKGDHVRFAVKPSRRSPGKYQAVNVGLVERAGALKLQPPFRPILADDGLHIGYIKRSGRHFIAHDGDGFPSRQGFRHARDAVTAVKVAHARFEMRKQLPRVVRIEEPEDEIFDSDPSQIWDD